MHRFFWKVVRSSKFNPVVSNRNCSSETFFHNTNPISFLQHSNNANIISKKTKPYEFSLAWGQKMHVSCNDVWSIHFLRPPTSSKYFCLESLNSFHWKFIIPKMLHDYSNNDLSSDKKLNSRTRPYTFNFLAFCSFPASTKVSTLRNGPVRLKLFSRLAYNQLTVKYLLNADFLVVVTFYVLHIRQVILVFPY